MYKRLLRNVIRSVLTLLCILSLALPAWAAESGPGSDTGVTVVTTKKASGKTTSEDTAAGKNETGENTDAQSRVITCGTGEAVKTDGAAKQTESSSKESGTKGASLGMFTTTGYCNCDQCSGGHNLTYSGTVPKARHTVSADLSVFPLGTRLMIGSVVYTVEDMGSSVKGNRLDIYYDDHDAAIAHGTKTEEVFAVES